MKSELLVIPATGEHAKYAPTVSSWIIDEARNGLMIAKGSEGLSEHFSNGESSLGFIGDNVISHSAYTHKYQPMRDGTIYWELGALVVNPNNAYRGKGFGKQTVLEHLEMNELLPSGECDRRKLRIIAFAGFSNYQSAGLFKSIGGREISIYHLPEAALADGLEYYIFDLTHLMPLRRDVAITSPQTAFALSRRPY
ncbi:MAG TPA: hypothetical protein VGT05_01995 [Patescibacteria group bacterium]|nr:hypothetical protein [Patescibacteria group bacterium]